MQISYYNDQSGYSLNDITTVQCHIVTLAEITGHPLDVWSNEWSKNRRQWLRERSSPHVSWKSVLKSWRYDSTLKSPSAAAAAHDVPLPSEATAPVANTSPLPVVALAACWNPELNFSTRLAKTAISCGDAVDPDTTKRKKREVNLMQRRWKWN